MKPKKQVKMRHILVLFLIVLLVSLSLGRYPVSPLTIIQVFWAKISGAGGVDSQVETVLFRIRIPRVLLGALVGAGLSCAGATYQGIFRNPMVSPDILGASWGAGFGAALGLFLSMTSVGVTIMAFAVGILAVVLVCLIGQGMRQNQKLGLILAGIMIGALFSSAVSFLKLVADPQNTLPAITYWLMGSLTSAKASQIWFAAPIILAGMIPIFLLRFRINVLTMSDDEARSMGVHTARLRMVLIICSTLITAAAVSVSGMIGWVGLVIPHFARMLFGSDYRRVIPASILLGAAYLVAVDDVARVITTSEIPLGILTAVIGAPFFLYLIRKEGRQS